MVKYNASASICSERKRNADDAAKTELRRGENTMGKRFWRFSFAMLALVLMIAIMPVQAWADQVVTTEAELISAVITGGPSQSTRIFH